MHYIDQVLSLDVYIAVSCVTAARLVTTS